MFYSGIDQHKRDSFITTYDDGGAIVNSARPSQSQSPLGPNEYPNCQELDETRRI